MSDSFVFDTSALIGAWSRTYPPDVFPGLWARMEGFAISGRMLVPEEVIEELKQKDDDLHVWVKARTQTAVAPTTAPLMRKVRDVLRDYRHLTKSGKGRGSADPFVIALAQIGPFVVVTEEKGGTASKPRIPYVCRELGIGCIAPVEFIRAVGWRF